MSETVLSKLLIKKKILVELLVFCLFVFACGAGFLALRKHQRESTKLASYIQDDAQTPIHVLPAQNSSTFSSLSQPIVHVPILMYHYIEHVKDKGDIMRQKLNTNPETLDHELKTLQDAGYKFVTMSDVNLAILDKKPLPAKAVVLTFDDGYRDFYTDALPILEKYHAKATAYIITGFIGQPNYMTLTQLTTVKKSGLIELGAHTVHHIDLKHASLKQAHDEIQGSKITLEKLFNDPVTTFAYPSGQFNDQAVQVVKEAGFTTAVTTMPGTQAHTQNQYLLFRLRAGGRTGKELLAFLSREMSH